MIRYASAGRRFWAFLLTGLVDLLVWSVLVAIVGGAEQSAAPFCMWLVIHHVAFVVEGGTIGQRLAGLRVTSVDGTRVRVVHAVVRSLAFVALSLPPLGLGVLWMLDQPQRRTWHDIVSSTVVVRETAPDAAPEWANDPPWRRAPEQPAPVIAAPVVGSTEDPHVG